MSFVTLTSNETAKQNSACRSWLCRTLFLICCTYTCCTFLVCEQSGLLIVLCPSHSSICLCWSWQTTFAVETRMQRGRVANYSNHGKDTQPCRHTLERRKKCIIARSKIAKSCSHVFFCLCSLLSLLSPISQLFRCLLYFYRAVFRCLSPFKIGIHTSLEQSV